MPLWGRCRCALRPAHLLSPSPQLLPGAAPQSLAQNRPLKHGVGGPTQPSGLQTPLLLGEALGSPQWADEQTEVPRRLGPSPSPRRAHAGPPTRGNLSPCGVRACAPSPRTLPAVLTAQPGQPVAHCT